MTAPNPAPVYRELPPRRRTWLSRLRYRVWRWLDAEAQIADIVPLSFRQRALLLALALPVCVGCGAAVWVMVR
jgi:hypothetical protein